MAVAMPRDDGPPVLVPGNPVRLSRVAGGPERRVPWLGEHTDDVLATELGLTTDERTALRADGVIA
jgi:crotonobetainyl-CoA:carnitine CoA-transferase CaiB-like acyl-CoA transferase